MDQVLLTEIVLRTSGHGTWGRSRWVWANPTLALFKQITDLLSGLRFLGRSRPIDFGQNSETASMSDGYSVQAVIHAPD